MEMHFKYLGKLTVVDEKIERERHVSKTFHCLFNIYLGPEANFNKVW